MIHDHHVLVHHVYVHHVHVHCPCQPCHTGIKFKILEPPTFQKGAGKSFCPKILFHQMICRWHDVKMYVKLSCAKQSSDNPQIFIKLRHTCSPWLSLAPSFTWIWSNLTAGMSVIRASIGSLKTAQIAAASIERWCDTHIFSDQELDLD